jgi:hypothetical protein
MAINGRIKKIISKKGKVMYYKGDGIWFGRTSAKEAEAGITSGKYHLFEVKDMRV